ncbi:MAG: flippase-like domain-containing protein [Clostridia bacterium]|nr:flippase-like domain-containing protein [Clostridia bacterium]
MDKGKIIKYLRNFILFALLIFLTFWIIFKDQDGEAFLDTMKNANWTYVLIGCLCMCCFIALEAFNIGRMLKHLGEKSTFLRNVKYAMIGFFFSAITPAASGGQPMQIYYMHKDGISIGSSSLTLLINITCALFVTIALSLFNLIFNYQYMTPGLTIFFIFGTVINSIAVLLFAIAIFSQKTLDKLMQIAKNILKRLTYGSMKKVKKSVFSNKKSLVSRIHDRHEKRIKKIEEHVNKYKENAKYLKENKIIILKTIILYFIQYTFSYSISYFAYLAVPIKDHIHSWFELTSLQSIVFATVSGIPSPGAVGVSEAAYIGLLGQVVPAEFLNSVLLLSRVMNFYLFVLLSAIVVIFAMIKVSRMNKKNEKSN